MHYTSTIIFANLVLFCLCVWMSSSYQIVQRVWLGDIPIPLAALAITASMFASSIAAGVSAMYLAQARFSDTALGALGFSTIFIVAEMQYSIGIRYRNAVIEYHHIGTSFVRS